MNLTVVEYNKLHLCKYTVKTKKLHTSISFHFKLLFTSISLQREMLSDFSNTNAKYSLVAASHIEGCVAAVWDLRFVNFLFLSWSDKTRKDFFYY